MIPEWLLLLIKMLIGLLLGDLFQDCLGIPDWQR